MADNQKGQTGRQDQGRNQGNSANLGNSGRTGNLAWEDLQTEVQVETVLLPETLATATGDV